MSEFKKYSQYISTIPKFFIQKQESLQVTIKLNISQNLNINLIKQYIPFIIENIKSNLNLNIVNYKLIRELIKVKISLSTPQKVNISEINTTIKSIQNQLKKTLNTNKIDFIVY